MVQVPKRPSLSGPALVRLLARLTDTPAVGPRTPLSGCLSQWLGWSDAITLSTVLNNDPPAVPTGRAVPGDALRRECDRLRSGLLASIDGDGKPSPGHEPDRRLRVQPALQQVAVDYAEYRQRYVSLQQSMESEIGHLRGRLRAMLAARSPEMTRLAMVDGLMERALAARERNLLSLIPGMLEKHFERLRQADGPAQEPNLRWLAAFRLDMRSVLRAELAVRMQSVEGLLAALLQPRQEAERN